MYKSKENIPSVYSLMSDLNKSDIKPIYFLFGDDSFTINNAIKSIEQKASQFAVSDFDKEVIDADKKDTLTNLIDLALMFPFGSEKKILIVKNFENYSNKKQFSSYVSDPSDYTILIIANYGKISNLSSEPYKLLVSKNYIFEARDLNSAELENWVQKKCKDLGFQISIENAKTLIEIVGEDKSLLDMQIQKMKSFLNDKNEITSEEIKILSSKTKEYTIFDLMNSLGKGQKKNSLKVIYNLLDTGKEIIFIISMLTKYFTVISQSLEMQQRKLNDYDASQEIGVSKYYYINCKKAVYFNNEHRLSNAFRALLKADTAVKTTGIDSTTLATILLTEIFME